MRNERNAPMKAPMPQMWTSIPMTALRCAKPYGW